MESQPQNPEFKWNVSLKILNSRIILKTFTWYVMYDFKEEVRASGSENVCLLQYLSQGR